MPWAPMTPSLKAVRRAWSGNRGDHVRRTIRVDTKTVKHPSVSVVFSPSRVEGEVCHTTFMTLLTAERKRHLQY